MTEIQEKITNAAGKSTKFLSEFSSQSHNTIKRKQVCLPVKRIFPAVKLRPQTPRPPIDKREIGDAAIGGERRIHTSPSPPPPSTSAIS